MAGDRSFTDYIRSRFFNECYALEGYVENNKDSLELELRNVRNVGEVCISLYSHSELIW